MLKLLNISNLAVVDSLQIEFGSGLNILSGETGSGKSIVVDALGILSGNRVTQELIRTGEEKAFVEGVIDIAGNTPLFALLADAGIEVDSDEIVIKREISTSGRGRVFVNNQSATLSLLKQVQPHIIDIHGQGDQQSLLASENHLRIFDSFINVTTLRHTVEAAYEQIFGLVGELESSQRSESERLQLLDLLEYQLKEIKKASLIRNEDDSLGQERNILANAERLAMLCDESYSILYDNEESALSQISQAQRRLDELAQVDITFEQYREQLASIKYTLEDIAYFIRNYAESVEASPERLRIVEDRLVEIERLKKKYGGSIESILETFSTLELKYDALKNNDVRAQRLIDEIKSALASYASVANQLSEQRKANSKKFEKLSASELAQVALEHARFKVNFEHSFPSDMRDRLSRFSVELHAKGAIGRFGQEAIEFYFSANTGEELRPIRDVASGGELSRLMLVLKTIIAPTQFPRTLIFDEIDTGIGGRVADAVGMRLKKLAATNQVLCVTHQAQIARYADTHFLVSKEVGEKRTKTFVEALGQQGKIEELARMLAGTEITVTAKKHARELLKSR
ncbi:MAG: DNA repair protein RecN [Acidobacteria bacterium]|nr:DNA repair protein RecN [Acidobacteriota bacterium]MBI3422879.1 DNA repair protein RecN [Acidobacteriota bacterium]